MVVHIKRKLKARIRNHDGSDKGCLSLMPGSYAANQTVDGSLQIIQNNVEPVYFLPFIWWEKVERGEIFITA
jgi:hypothetical protein